MARNTATTARTATTAPAAQAAPTTTTAPVGATTTTAAGTPQGQVPHLAALAAHGVALAAPTAAWPGWGKAVRVGGTHNGTAWQGAAYANRGNIDLRAPHAVCAALAASVPGAQVRGGGNYVRLPHTATGTPQA